MKKRVLASLLWFYAIWYSGAMVAHFMGISPVLGPVLGAAAAVIIAVDPRGLIWTRADRAVRDSAATASSPQVANPA